MERLKQEIMSVYEGEGYCRKGAWKAFSDVFFGKKQAVEVWGMLQGERLLPANDQPLTFVSPSVHTPTHELAIWEETQTREGLTRFLMGDIREVPYGRFADRFNKSSSGEHFFSFLRLDAEQLPLKRGSVDVLWDRKGWLWHLASDVKDLRRLWSAMDSYYDYLKPGGIAVVDAIEGFPAYSRELDKDEERTRKLEDYARLGKKISPIELYPNPPFQFEESTVDALEGISPNIWDDYALSFNIIDLGKDATRVRVLQKKPNGSLC